MTTPIVAEAISQKTQADSLNATDLILLTQLINGSNKSRKATLSQLLGFLTSGLGSITITGQGGNAVLTNGSLTFTRINPGHTDDGKEVKFSFVHGLELGDRPIHLENLEDYHCDITPGKIRMYHTEDDVEIEDCVIETGVMTVSIVNTNKVVVNGAMTVQPSGISVTATESHSGAEQHTGTATFQRIAVNNLEATSNSSFRGIETHQSTEYHTGIETHGGMEIHNGAASFNALSSKALDVERSVAMSIGDPSVDDERNRSVFPVSASTTSNPYWSLSEYNRVGAIKYIYNANTTSAYVSFPVRTLKGDQTIKLYQSGCVALLCIDVTSDTLATYAILGDDWNA